MNFKGTETDWFIVDENGIPLSFGEDEIVVFSMKSEAEEDCYEGDVLYALNYHETKDSVTEVDVTRLNDKEHVIGTFSYNEDEEDDFQVQLKAFWKQKADEKLTDCKAESENV